MSSVSILGLVVKTDTEQVNIEMLGRETETVRDRDRQRDRERQRQRTETERERLQQHEVQQKERCRNTDIEVHADSCTGAVSKYKGSPKVQSHVT